jgi:hypothetical protein
MTQDREISQIDQLHTEIDQILSEIKKLQNSTIISIKINLKTGQVEKPPSLDLDFHLLISKMQAESQVDTPEARKNFKYYNAFKSFLAMLNETSYFRDTTIFSMYQTIYEKEIRHFKNFLEKNQTEKKESLQGQNLEVIQSIINPYLEATKILEFIDKKFEHDDIRLRQGLEIVEDELQTLKNNPLLLEAVIKRRENPALSLKDLGLADESQKKKNTISEANYEETREDFSDRILEGTEADFSANPVLGQNVPLDNQIISSSAKVSPDPGTNETKEEINGKNSSVNPVLGQNVPLDNQIINPSLEISPDPGTNETKEETKGKNPSSNPVLETQPVSSALTQNISQNYYYKKLTDYCDKELKGKEDKKTKDKYDALSQFLNKISQIEDPAEQVKRLAEILENKAIKTHRRGGPHISEPETVQLIKKLIKEINPSHVKTLQVDSNNTSYPKLKLVITEANKSTRKFMQSVMQDFEAFHAKVTQPMQSGCSFFSRKREEFVVEITPRKDFNNSSAYCDLLNTFLRYDLISDSQKKSGLDRIEDFYFDKQCQSDPGMSSRTY